MNTIASWIDIFNFELPFGRWQLFEFCDLDVYATFTVTSLAVLH